MRQPPTQRKILPSALARRGHLEVFRDLHRAHVDEQEIAAIGSGVAQPEFIEIRGEDVAALGVLFELLGEEVVLHRALEADRDALLHGAVGAEDDLGVRCEHGGDERRGTDKPAYASDRDSIRSTYRHASPYMRRTLSGVNTVSGKRELTPARPHGQRPLPHAGERRDPHVLLVVIHHTIVHLVRHHQHALLNADLRELFQLGPGEHLADRVVRRVDDDAFGLRGERGSELVEIDAPVGPTLHALAARRVE